MKLSPHQQRLLSLCVSTGRIHSKATIQNTTRSLVRAGLIERYRVAGRVYLRATDTGRREWSAQMQSRKASR